jgi:hypothetical protein
VGEDVAGVCDERGVGETEAIKVGGEGLEVEAEPRVAAKAIEVGGVRREKGELVQSGSEEMRREAVVVSGRFLW